MDLSRFRDEANSWVLRDSSDDDVELQDLTLISRTDANYPGLPIFDRFVKRFGNTFSIFF
jgi:hypothetical protein